MLLSRFQTSITTLAATAMLAAAAAAQGPVTLSHRGVFSGGGMPVSTVQGITNRLGCFSGTGSVVAQLPNGLLGTFVWQGSGGNSISGTFQLTLSTMLAPGVFVFFEQATTTGGTGLYANATGNDQAVGVINLASSQFVGALNGHLTLH